jgi:hypothetical protein
MKQIKLKITTFRLSQSKDPLKICSIIFGRLPNPYGLQKSERVLIKIIEMQIYQFWNFIKNSRLLLNIIKIFISSINKADRERNDRESSNSNEELSLQMGNFLKYNHKISRFDGNEIIHTREIEVQTDHQNTRDVGVQTDDEFESLKRKADEVGSEATIPTLIKTKNGNDSFVLKLKLIH